MKNILIVNYHYCAPVGAMPGCKGVTPDIFDKQLASISKAYKSLCLNDLTKGKSEDDAEVGFMISFDDGMKDVEKYAIPLLNKYNIPYTIFCCAMPYEEGRVLNVQKTHLLCGRWGWDKFKEKFQCALNNDPEGDSRDNVESLKLARMYRYDDAETAAFRKLLNVELPYHILNRILDKLFEAEFGNQKEVVPYLYMSLDEIKRCVDENGSIGLHTNSHCMLSRLTKEEQAKELDLSLSLLRDKLGLDISTISYPYGIRGSWDEHTKSLATERGINLGFTLDREIYNTEVHTDNLEIPRFDVNDVFDKDYSLKL